MEDIITKTCARCGQPVDRTKESWKQTGSQVVHTACPTSLRQDVHPAPGLPQGAASASPEMKELKQMDALPTAEAAPTGNQSETGVRALVFLTIEETAKILRVSDSTIRRKIRSGELPAKRLKGGQTVLIDERDVLGLLEDARGAV